MAGKQKKTKKSETTRREAILNVVLNRSLLMGILVIVATVGAIQVLRGPDEAPAAADQPAVEDEALQVSPLVPPGAITGASWRTDAAAGPDPVDEDATDSVLDTFEFGDTADRRRRFEKSLEKTVSEIHGLGVYVEPNDPKDDDGKKN